MVAMDFGFWSISYLPKKSERDKNNRRKIKMMNKVVGELRFLRKHILWLKCIFLSSASGQSRN